MKAKIDLRRLCGGLSEELYRDLEIGPPDMNAAQGKDDGAGATGGENIGQQGKPDMERVKGLVFEKLHGQTQTKEQEPEKEKKVKRISHKLLIAAALIAVLTTTAFAAGGLDFFRALFGDSVEQVEKNIQQVGISVKNDDLEMTAEQLISDGYNTKIIVSLRPLSEAAQERLLSPEVEAVFTGGPVEKKDVENLENGELSFVGQEHLSQFDTEEKTYFCVTYSSNQEYPGSPIRVRLAGLSAADGEGAPVGFDFAEGRELELLIEDPERIAAQKTITFEKTQGTEECRPVSLSINAISAVLTLQTPVGSADTVTMDAAAVMKDGSKEILFESGWVEEGSENGHTAAIADDPRELPLVSGYSYSRQLETGLILQTANFSRIINVEEVDYVLVGGVKYTL